MSNKRARMTGRRERGKRFALIPADVIHCANWAQASKPMRALVADIAVQFTGFNNSDLCASITVMRPLGWTSSDTLRALLREAVHYGFLVQTRQGGMGLGPNLYALGWKPIDACTDRKTGRSKLDDPGMVGTMPGRWQVTRCKFDRLERSHKKQNATPPHGAMKRLPHRPAVRQCAT